MMNPMISTMQFVVNVIMHAKPGFIRKYNKKVTHELHIFDHYKMEQLNNSDTYIKTYITWHHKLLIRFLETPRLSLICISQRAQLQMLTGTCPLRRVQQV